MTQTKKLLVGVLTLGMLAAACGDGDGHVATTASTAATAVIEPGDGGHYDPVVDPADFVDRIDNPYVPLIPASKWVYEGTADGEPEHDEVAVTSERKTILGIPAIVVRDTVSADGAVTEDTFDWYAQDRNGNVWYLGEDSKTYDHGTLTGTEGSWEAGVDGARPGIVMPAHPKPGDANRQEFSPGVAEDLGQVTHADTRIRVPAGRYRHVIVTKEWSPLEPRIVEQKRYAPGIGLVAEDTLQGGHDRTRLVAFTPGS